MITNTQTLNFSFMSCFVVFKDITSLQQETSIDTLYIHQKVFTIQFLKSVEVRLYQFVAVLGFVPSHVNERAKVSSKHSTLFRSARYKYLFHVLRLGTQ